MTRAMPPRPVIHGPRTRVNLTPRVLILSDDAKLGDRLRSEMRQLLAEPWFAVYRSIDDYHASEDGDVIHDLVIYCSQRQEKPETVKQAIGRIKLFCPERDLRIILYSANREVPADARIVAVVQQTNENELAEVISKLLCPEAA